MTTVGIAEPVLSNNELLDIIENLKRDNDLLKKENRLLKESLTKKKNLLSKLIKENTNLTKNNDLFLRKIIKNKSLFEENGILLIDDNEIKKNWITEDKIDKISLNGSSILEFVIKYNNSKIKINKKRAKYCNEIQMLKDIFLKEDSNRVFREYLNMIKLNKYQIYICIQLKNKEIVFFKT